MMEKNKVIPIQCSLMRCGTSKVVFIPKQQLPEDPVARDSLILALFGSPDLRQVDGLGGADSAYSKVAIIDKAACPGADVDYTYGQVSLDRRFIDYNGNCGNAATGVGVYAILKGLVKPQEPITIVRIRLTNSGRLLEAKIKVQNGMPEVDGNFVDGTVPGTGSEIEMNWAGITGSITGKLLPTGNAIDHYEIDHEQFEVSVVDAGNVVIYLDAARLGLNGDESPATLNADRNLCEKLEKLRGTICVQLGLVKKWEDASKITPLQPFVALVSKSDHADSDCIISRLTLMQKFIALYPGTALVNMGAAQSIKGTIVHRIIPKLDETGDLSVCCASGPLNVHVSTKNDLEVPEYNDITIRRTARMLMDGTAFVRASVL